MKRTLLHLFLICLAIGLCSTVAYADDVFSVTTAVKDIGPDILKQAGSHVKEGFILVPEPSSILLFGSGVLALVKYASKRKKKHN